MQLAFANVAFTLLPLGTALSVPVPVATAIPVYGPVVGFALGAIALFGSRKVPAAAGTALCAVEIAFVVWLMLTFGAP